MTYIYKTINTAGMNTRPDHNVLNAANGSVAYNVPTECTEIWTAPADGSYVKAGDKWAKLNSGIIKWVAIIHLGKVYGNVTEVTPPPVDPPAPAPVFPDSFVMTEPKSGAKAEYVFVRILP